MEELVFGCVGALVAVGVAAALPGGDLKRGALRGRPRSAREAVDAVAAAFGTYLVAALGISLERGVPGRVLWAVRLWDPKGVASDARRGSEALIGMVSLVVIASALAGLLLSGSPAGLAVGAALPMAALALGARSAGARRASEVETAMPEAFKALAIALGSGCSLAQAMRFVGSHAREPVRTEFMRVGFSIDCGISATEALDGLLARLRAPGLDMVALALKVSQRTGSPLKDLLVQASDAVGLRMQLKRQLDVKTSQARMSARMVAGMPVALIGVLSLLSPDFRVGVARPAGAVSIALALALNAVAWTVINRIMKVRI
ncbi:MAG: type II secretion system F family protein [Collinsella sp.]|nr:type II secretion system F family protein [Collinsella sp.]